jgi:hypothetical protein
MCQACQRPRLAVAVIRACRAPPGAHRRRSLTPWPPAGRRAVAQRPERSARRCAPVDLATVQRQEAGQPDSSHNSSRAMPASSRTRSSAEVVPRPHDRRRPGATSPRRLRAVLASRAWLRTRPGEDKQSGWNGRKAKPRRPSAGFPRCRRRSSSRDPFGWTNTAGSSSATMKFAPRPAWIPPSRHLVHRGSRIPGSRAEPFSPSVREGDWSCAPRRFRPTSNPAAPRARAERHRPNSLATIHIRVAQALPGRLPWRPVGRALRFSHGRTDRTAPRGCSERRRIRDPAAGGTPGNRRRAVPVQFGWAGDPAA